jgi:hypothetical protein
MSVKDYLLSTEIRDSRASAFALEPIAGNRELALDCFTYLTFKDFQTGPCQSQPDFASRLAKYPFLRHASTAWTYYLRASDPTAPADDQILNFFSPKNRQALLSWVQILNAQDPGGESKWHLYPRHATSLYYASSFGLIDVVKRLIRDGADLNVPGSRFGGTALHGAVCRDQIPIIKTLLEAGALPNQSDFDCLSPLHTAASEGYVESLKLLLEYGASPDAKDRGGETPIDWARKSHQPVTLQLLTGSPPVNEASPKELGLKVWNGFVGSYIPEWYRHHRRLAVHRVATV